MLCFLTAWPALQAAHRATLPLFCEHIAHLSMAGEQQHLLSLLSCSSPGSVASLHGTELRKAVQKPASCTLPICFGIQC